MVSVCLSSAWCSLSETLRKENVLIFLASCVELLISMMEMNTSLLVRDSVTNEDVFISYVEKANKSLLLPPPPPKNVERGIY